MSPDIDRAALIERIKCFPEELSQLVGDLTSHQLTTVSIPAEWTVQQIIHHLADSHMNAHIRTKLILTMDNPPLQGYPQDAWAQLPDVNTVPIRASLAILEGVHARWAALFSRLSENEWHRTGCHSENGAVSIQDILSSYAQHGLDHIDQIQRVLAAQG